jgi:hypothetical protein
VGRMAGGSNFSLSISHKSAPEMGAAHDTYVNHRTARPKTGKFIFGEIFARASLLNARRTSNALIL